MGKGEIFLTVHENLGITAGPYVTKDGRHVMLPVTAIPDGSDVAPGNRHGIETRRIISRGQGHPVLAEYGVRIDLQLLNRYFLHGSPPEIIPTHFNYNPGLNRTK